MVNARDNFRNLETSKFQVMTYLYNLKTEIQTSVNGVLHWNYRNMKIFPEELLHYGKENVIDIYMKGNEIQKIPCWIIELRNLTELHLFANNLREIPDEIIELKSLRILNVGRNSINVLPKTFTSLTWLNSFFADENTISCLPRDIGNLKSLTCLHLSDNRLKNIPHSIGECTKLQEVIADNNDIKSLPNSLVYLQNLSRISFRGNKFIHLPAIPPISKPVMLFGDTNFLTSISQEFLVQMLEYNFSPFNFTIERCNESEMHVDQCIRTVSKSGNILIIPFKRVYYKNSNYVVPLYELCLRNVCKLINLNRENVKKQENSDYIFFLKTLPATIQNEMSSPIAFCHYCRCCLFRYSWMRVFELITADLDVDTGHKTEVIRYFCSSYCSKLSSHVDILKSPIQRLFLHEIEWNLQ